MFLFNAYWDICRSFKFLAIAAVLLLGMTGLLEGSALLSLVPILEAGLERHADASAGYIGAIADWLSIPKDRVIHLAIATFVVLGLSSALVRVLSESLLLFLRSRIEERARAQIGDALLDMEWTRYLELRLGDISKSIIIEGQQMAVGCQMFLQSLGAFLVALVYLLIAFVISVKLTFLSMLFGGVVAMLYYVMSGKARKHADMLSALVGAIGDQVAEIFGNLKFFRSAGLSVEAGKRARQIYRHYAHTYFWTYIYANALRFAFEGVAVIFVALILSMSFFVYHEPVSSALVFLVVFYRLAPRVLSVQENLFQSRTYLSWYLTWKRRLEVIRAYREQERGKIVLPELEKIELVGVSFSYPKSSRPAVNDVHLAIFRGEAIAVVGHSGSGKSTLIDLLTGLLGPTSGVVKVNGIDLKELDPEAWRRHIGVVIQDSPVFHATILQNIGYGDKEPDPERAQAAAQAAHALEFIRELPPEFGAVVGEKGGRLSGGQRQRLALARALYGDPWLLILDEATSALDGEAEAIIQDTLRALKRKFTIIIVAHRLKTVQMADRIVVIDRGEILEQGTWDELLSLPHGVFRRMAKLQGIFQRAV